MPFQKNQKIYLFLILAIFLTASFGIINYASAEDEARVNAIKDKIDNHKDSLEQLNSEISQLKNQIDTVGKQKKTLQNELKSIDLVRQKIKKEAEITKIKAQRTNTAINILDRSIKDKHDAITRQRLAVAYTLQKIAENDQRSLIELLLANASISDAFKEADQFEELQEGFVEQMQKLRGLTKDLNSDKQAQEEEYKKAKLYSKELDEKKGIVEEKRIEQDQLVKQTSKKESEFQAQLKEKERRKKQFEQELESYESELKIAVDTTTFPSVGTKALLAPIPGARLTQHFGYTAAAKTLYASGKHTGTDFAAQVGTSIKAAAGGTVVATGDTDIACRGASYGKYVYIVHKNGLATLYAHLSKISVSPGEWVDANQHIAYSGNTGYSTGPHLHLGVYVASATKIDNVPSKSCAGAIFRMPVAPKEAYLDFENYF
jgi:murein DD-endopeptidase MepM/ murein hydrolase activator NlpD